MQRRGRWGVWARLGAVSLVLLLGDVAGAAEVSEQVRELLRRAGEAESGQAWQEAADLYRAALGAGLSDPAERTQAYYKVGKACHELYQSLRAGDSRSAAERQAEAAAAYREAIQLDLQQGLNAPAARYALEAIQKLLPEGATLFILGTATKSYKLWRVQQDQATELGSGSVPAVVVDPKAATYLVYGCRSETGSVVWSQTTVSRGGVKRLQLDTDSQPSCWLCTRFDPGFADAELELGLGGIRLPVVAGSVACPPGRHTVVVTASNYQTVRQTIEMEAPGDVIWLQTIRLRPAPR